MVLLRVISVTDLPYSFLHQFFHYLISFQIRMNTVFRVNFRQSAFQVAHRTMVVHINYLVCFGIRFYFTVQLSDGFSRFNFRPS